MANKRDVELVIRAKNEATKAVDSVTESLAALKKVQDDVSKSSDRTGGFVEKLGTQLKKLQAESKGLEAFGRIAVSLERAGGAVKRMESDLAGSSQELTRLRTEAQQFSQATTVLKANVEQAAAALQKQKTATAAARLEQSNANREVRNAEGALSRLAARIASAKAPNDALAASYEKQKATLVDLQQRQAQAAQRYAAEKVAVTQAAAALRGFQEQMRATAQAQSNIQTSADKTAIAVERQTKALATAKGELAQIKGVADQAAQSFQGVAVTENAITVASQKTAQALSEVEAALKRQKTATVSGSGQGPAATATAAFRAQIDAVRASSQAMQEAQARASELGRAMASTVAPTEAQKAAFLLAREAVATSRAEYLRSAQALNQLKGVTQGTFAAFDQRVRASQRSAQADREATSSANTLAGVLRNLAQAFLGVATASDRAASTGSRLKGAFSAFYGDSRQALSLFQRLRGEILGLSAQYVGLYAAIQNIGGVVNAYRTIEAAQNRLGAAFNQDTAQTTQEMRFLQVQANKLGISFAVLSDEYSKFAIAASASNFSAETTRKIFLSVAEAARVQKLSLENTQGVFLALQQIISKGKVSSEELRRQMGDRLPGAFNIFAKAMGVSAAQLDKLLRDGEVLATEDTLLKFADELTNRFGAQLPQALQSVTTEIGRFQNNIFQAQTQVAQGGFIEGLREGLENLNEFFRSKEGVEFFTSLGAALGKFVTIIAQAPKYFDLIGKGIQLIISYKLAQVIGNIVAQFIAFNARVAASGASLTTFAGTATALNVRMTALRAAFSGAIGAITGFAARMQSLGPAAAAATVGMATLRGGITLLAGTFRVLLAAVGGLPGLLAVLASFALTELFVSWAGAVEDANAALAEHERIVAAVGEAYDASAGKVGNLADKIKGVSLIQAEDNFRNLQKVSGDADYELKIFTQTYDAFWATVASLEGNEEKLSLFRLVNEFRDGKITVEEFRDRIEQLNRTFTDDAAKRWASDLFELANTSADLQAKLGEAANIAEDMGSKMDSVAESSKKGNLELATVDKTAGDLAKTMEGGTSAIDGYSKAMQELGEKIPGVKAQLDSLKEINEISRAVADGIAAIQGLPDGQKAFLTNQIQGRADQAILQSQLKSASGFLESATVVIKKFEGFSSEAFFDVNAFRAGFGSDTITLADGSIHKITQGMRVSVEDANRDLTRRIGEFASTVQRQIGEDTFAQFGKEQQAVLTSIAYNFGSLPDKLVAAIKTGNTQTIAETIRHLSDSQPILKGRRSQEADLFLAGGTGFDQASLDARLKAEQSITEEQLKQQQATQTRIENAQFELSQEELKATGMERQAFIQDQIRQAKEENKNITAQELEQVEQLAGKTFDFANAKKISNQEQKTQLQEQKALEDALNQAIEYRKQLMEAIAFARTQGDTAKVDELTAKLGQADAQIEMSRAAIERFWQSAGGPQADAAILKANNMAAAVSKVGTNSQQSTQLTNTFVNGLSNAFSSIAQNIATVIQQGGSLKDILKGVGQAFLKFAADFLLQMGQMIVKQALFNALGGGGGGGTGGGFGGFLSGLFHAGGIVGRGGQKRMANPAWFVNAPRFHEGGIPGLRGNEMAAVLKRNEEVLTEDDPRHAFNLSKQPGMGGGGVDQDRVRVINAFDPSEFMERALGTATGERAILNWIRANSGAFKGALS